ncbi:unnamed protein product, partial [Candidula unifasciata]
VYNVQDGIAADNTASSEEGAQKKSSDEGDQNRQQHVEATGGASAAGQVVYSKTLKRTWHYLLTDWSRQVKQLQKDQLPVNLDNIVSKKLSTMVDLVLRPVAPPEWRHACLVVLLSQETDQELTSRVLNHTVGDALCLPLKVIIDIIQTLTTSFQTPLRVDARKQLVTTTINHRYCEIPAKYIVLFMYQMDELFNMKLICKQQFHKEKLRNPIVQGHEYISGGKHDKTLVGTNSPANDDLGAKVLGGDNDVPHILNIEHRATSIVDDFKTKDLARMMILLAKWRNRNQTLINAVVHGLSQADFSDFHVVQLSNLLLSFSMLNIYSNPVLRNIVLHLTRETPTAPSQICTVLSSLSHLRWNDEALVSKYLCFLADDICKLTVTDAQSLLTSLANLYIVPTTDAETSLIFKIAKIAFSGDLTPASKVHCAWCLAVLLSLSAEVGQSLLQPAFLSQLSDVDDAQKQSSLHKLCSISTALQYEVKDYSRSGLLLPEVPAMSPAQDRTGCCDRGQISELKKCLQKFVDVTSYVSWGQTLMVGPAADAVMCADMSGDLRPLNTIEDENIYKLAIQLVPFSGVLCVTGSPCGSYSMAARHWKHLGYVPVQILYSDLKPSLSCLEKISIIKTKIQSAVKKFVAERQRLKP